MNRYFICSAPWVFLLLSTYTSIIDKILSRNMFYASIILALISAFKFKINFEFKLKTSLLSLSFFVFGLCQLLWWYKYGVESKSIFFLADRESVKVAKIFIASSIILTIFPMINKPNERVILYASGLGFLYIIINSISYLCHDGNINQVIFGDGRLELSNVATTSAYFITLQSLLTVFIVSNSNIKNKSLTIWLVISLSMLLIFITKTRSAIIIYPLSIAVMFLFIKKQIKEVALILAIIISLSICVKSVSQRILSSYNEISNYSINNDTSIGSRLSLWVAGFSSIEKKPFGQSSKERMTFITSYIKSKEMGNKEAIRNIQYHLHNELIESSSLKGLLGFFSVIFLYASMMQKSILDKNKHLLIMLLLPFFLFGISDVLMLFPEMIIILCGASTFYSFYRKK